MEWEGKLGQAFSWVSVTENRADVGGTGQIEKKK